MGWGGPTKKTGWGRVTEGASRIEQRLYTVIRAIQEVVPGGVLRAGKTAFAQGSGWLLSVTDGGAGIADIGDEDNYLRFDGTHFTWRTPLTYLDEDGTLSVLGWEGQGCSISMASASTMSDAAAIITTWRWNTLPVVQC